MKLTIGSNVYDFEYRVNSIVELEREAKCTVGEVLAFPEYTMFRLMLWAGLIRNHNLTLESVGDLVEEFLKENDKNSLVKVITDGITEAGFMGAQGKRKGTRPK